MAAIPRSAERRLQEIDALRGIAALAVLLFHYTTRYDQLYGARGDVPFGFPDGGYGVHLFFVISGFVIFMTLRRCVTAADFLVSRFSRLYPVYWTAVLATFAVGTLWPLPGQHYGAAQLAANLTMLQEFAAIPPIDGVYWSLTVELGFYAVMLALFLAGALASTTRIAVAWLAAAAGAAAATRLGLAIPFKVEMLFVLNYAELFVAGIVFHEIFTRGADARRVALIAACLGVETFAHGLAVGAHIAAIFALFGFAVSGRAAILRLKPLIWLGAISYPLYLTHELIGYRVLRLLADHGVTSTIAIPLTAAGALLLAHALNRGVERPAMRALRRFHHQRHGQPATGPSVP